MSGKRELRIQSAFLLVLVPTLFFVTCIAGYLVYSSLYSDILAGFDARLRSVSTVTAAFIDPAEHDRILQPFDIQAAAFDPRGDRLFAADSDKRLLVIDRMSGSAHEVGRLDVRFLDLAWDPRQNCLLGLEAPGTRLRTIDPISGNSRTVLELKEPFRALAWEPSSGLVYLAGTRLTAIDPHTWTVQRTADLGSLRLLALADGPAVGILLGTLPEVSELARIDLSGSRPVVSTVPFRFGTAAGDSEDIAPSRSSELRFLTYDPNRKIFWGGSDCLLRLEPENFRIEVTGYPGFRNESTPLYQKYVLPMRRIKQLVRLTYLYTFVLGHRDREIIYGLDANTDNDHSNIGDVDSDPPEEGTVRVFHQGGVHLSNIEFWEQWGLIKSADAAVYDHEGDVRAIAGADINISIIEQKTRSALFKVCLIGILCLGFASLAAVKVSNRLVRPIEQLKSEALKVAAGQFGETVRIDSPTELKELAHSFNGMSAALESTLAGLTESNRKLENERRRTELVLSIAARTDSTHPDAADPIVCGRIFIRPRLRDASGWRAASGQLYVWLVSPSPEDPFEAVRFRSDLATIFEHLLRSCGNRWNAARQFFEPLFRDRVPYLVQIECDRGIRCRALRGSIPLGVISAQGTLHLRIVDEGECFPLQEQEGFLLTDPALIRRLVEMEKEVAPQLLADGAKTAELLAGVAASLALPERDFLFVSGWRSA